MRFGIRFDNDVEGLQLKHDMSRMPKRSVETPLYRVTPSPPLCDRERAPQNRSYGLEIVRLAERHELIQEAPVKSQTPNEPQKLGTQQMRPWLRAENRLLDHSDPLETDLKALGPQSFFVLTEV
jgi:hypothetical protein